jgi:hypothetical protein
VGQEYTIEPSGLSDFDASCILQLKNTESQLLLLNLEMNVPSVSIDARTSDFPMQDADFILPYIMQFGSVAIEGYFDVS